MLYKLTNEKIKERELKILLQFQDFCKQNNLKFFLDSGTLLGAVRHKGFIPWDDDIDVVMPIEDFNKLISLGKNNIHFINENLKVVSYDINKYHYPFIKIFDCKTSSINTDTKSTDGLWIDVFPLSNIDDKNSKLFKKTIFLRKLCLAKQLHKRGSESIIKFMCKYLLKIILLPIRYQYLLKKILTYVHKFDDKDTEFVANLSWITKIAPIKKTDLISEENLVFEGYKFPVINNYKQYLTVIYGDYMKLPPESKRKTHSFTAYISK